jgi:hypothetical protein
MTYYPVILVDSEILVAYYKSRVGIAHPTLLLFA